MDRSGRLRLRRRSRPVLRRQRSQLTAQLRCRATVVVVGAVTLAFIVFFKLSALITPLRVTREVELEGLDGPEMGSLGYPDFELKGTSLDA